MGWVKEVFAWGNGFLHSGASSLLDPFRCVYTAAIKIKIKIINGNLHDR